MARHPRAKAWRHVGFPLIFAVVCFDAKINFDDNAQFRQQEIFAGRDTAEEVGDMR